MQRLFGITGSRVVRWQEGLAHRIGDIRLSRRRRPLITEAQITGFGRRLLPGDILLARQEFFLSNLAMPGFWKHSAIHVGTPSLRRRYFDCPEVAAWVRRQGASSGHLEDLLRQRHPEAYDQCLQTHGGRPVRNLESLCSGVGFTSLEYTGAVDSLAVLRPRLTKLARAQALANAFSFVGRPYDYRFDFSTDDSLICSELVYKSYHPRADQQGLGFALREIAGGPPTVDTRRGKR